MFSFTFESSSFYMTVCELIARTYAISHQLLVKKNNKKKPSYILCISKTGRVTFKYFFLFLLMGSSKPLSYYLLSNTNFKRGKLHGTEKKNEVQN